MKHMIIEDKAYSPEEVFSLIGEEYLLRKTDAYKHTSDMVVDGFNVRPVSLRYMLFYQKGTQCVCCGKSGTHFKLCGDPDTNRRHFNLFADDGSLLTKDHIVPKSKGGRDHVDNMQTMCEACNQNKGNYHDTIKVDYIVATRVDSDKSISFRDISKAAFHMVQNYLHPPKKNYANVIQCSISAVLSIQNALETGVPYCGYTWLVESR